MCLSWSKISMAQGCFVTCCCLNATILKYPGRFFGHSFPTKPVSALFALSDKTLAWEIKQPSQMLALINSSMAATFVVRCSKSLAHQWLRSASNHTSTEYNRPDNYYIINSSGVQKCNVIFYYFLRGRRM